MKTIHASVVCILVFCNVFLFSWPLYAQVQTEQINKILQAPEGVSVGSEDVNATIRGQLTAAPTFWMNFRFYDAGGNPRDAGQCGLTGTKNGPLGIWTGYIRVNTDDGWGDCILQFAITDPSRLFPHLKMYVNIQPSNGARSDQCPVPGEREILPTQVGPDWSKEIYLNMGNPLGGCELTFRIENPTKDIQLHLEVWPDDEGVGQCPTPTRGPRTPNAPEYFTVAPGNPKAIVLDTDGRWGGCMMRFRLYRPPS
jgi:hypothetical protein